jgi:outer membrane receptor protein involved in Fe transport
MLKNFYTLLLLLLVPFNLPAQNRASNQPPNTAFSGVRGVITDGSNQEPLPYATVAAWQDDALVDGGVTDIDGKYQIELPPGTYRIIANFIGYQNSSPVEVTLTESNPGKRMPPIALQPAEEMLEAVEVEGNPLEMQLSLDKKVFNVSENLAARGGTATDILDNVPSVAVDVEGNVSLRGSENVRILINGKPSGLTGANALRQLPADLIERVEVITNPSARYEAQGMAGIINIVLKKNQQKGLNGSVDLTTGYPANHGASVNLNFRREKFNYFINTGVRRRVSPGGGFNYQQFNREDTTDLAGREYYFDERNQNQDRTRADWSYNVRLGSDFYLTDNDVITGSFLFNQSFGDNSSDLTYDFIRDGALQLSSVRTQTEDELDKNLEWNLDYRRTYDEKDKSLSLTTQYRNNIDDEQSDFLENYFLPGGQNTGVEDFQNSSNYEEEREFIGQLDFVDPFDGGQYELGFRTSFRNIGNEYEVNVRDAEGNLQQLEAFTANFDYDEQVHAAYVQGGFKLDPWSFQAGLRGEYTSISTTDRTGPNNRDFLNLFPSVFANYSFSDRASVQASYSRRIRRPGFRQLNPFFSFSDSRSFRTGNPDINPELTDSYELGYLRTWNKVSLTTSLFYRRTTHSIEYITVPAIGATELEEFLGGGQPLQSLPINISSTEASGLEVVLSADLAKWWTVNGNMNFFYNTSSPYSFNYQVTEELVEPVSGEGFETFAAQGRFASRQRFKGGLSLQQTLFYRSGQNTLQGSRRAITFLSLAASQELWNRKGTLTFTVDDVFNLRKWRSETVVPGENGFSANSEFQWRVRSFTLSLNYLINQDKRDNRRQRGRGEGDMDGDMGDF